MCPLLCVQTSVERTCLLEASCWSLWWVSCSQLSLSDCSCDFHCTCPPPTGSLLLAWHLTFDYYFLPLRCVLASSLCMLGGHRPEDSFGPLLSDFWWCQCILQRRCWSLFLNGIYVLAVDDQGGFMSQSYSRSSHMTHITPIPTESQVQVHNLYGGLYMTQLDWMCKSHSLLNSRMMTQQTCQIERSLLLRSLLISTRLISRYQWGMSDQTWDYFHLQTNVIIRRDVIIRNYRPITML